MTTIIYVDDDDHHLQCQALANVEKAMANSKTEKALNHARIVESASVRFRQDGIDGVGVADLMKGVGMTHGGFYRHFTSRDELVAEAVECAFVEGRDVLARVASQKRPADAFSALVDGYLSASHRDQLSTSCALTTLSSDVARSASAARSAYSKQVEAYVDRIATLVATEKVGERRAGAIAALSLMVGALALARATNDADLSEEILQSAATQAKRHFIE